MNKKGNISINIVIIAILGLIILIIGIFMITDVGSSTFGKENECSNKGGECLFSCPSGYKSTVYSCPEKGDQETVCCFKVSEKDVEIVEDPTFIEMFENE